MLLGKMHENDDWLVIMNADVQFLHIYSSMHSMLSRDTIILRQCVHILGMFMELKK